MLTNICNINKQLYHYFCVEILYMTYNTISVPFPPLGMQGYFNRIRHYVLINLYCVSGLENNIIYSSVNEGNISNDIMH